MSPVVVKGPRDGLAQRIDVAPVRTPPRPRALRRRIDDDGLGKRYPGEQVRANPLANQTFANQAPHRARGAPGPPVRLRVVHHSAIQGGGFKSLAEAKT
jgi:hypothetical protein